MLNDENAQILSSGLLSTWNAIGPDLDAPESSSSDLVQACYDYLTTYANDSGESYKLLQKLITEHGYHKVTKWISDYCPLGY